MRPAENGMFNARSGVEQPSGADIVTPYIEKHVCGSTVTFVAMPVHASERYSESDVLPLLVRTHGCAVTPSLPATATHLRGIAATGTACVPLPASA